MRYYAFGGFETKDEYTVSECNRLQGIVNEFPDVYQYHYKQFCNTFRKALNSNNLLGYYVTEDAVYIMEFAKICKDDNDFQEIKVDENTRRYYVEV